jgi:serine/threonine protein kinase/Flp pilus assembly protein TadD
MKLKTPIARPSSVSVSCQEDEQVVRAVRTYLALVEEGQKPERLEFAARYPEIAPALAECLAGLDFVQAAAPELSGTGRLRAPMTDVDEGTPLGDFRIIREVGRGGMGIVYEAEQLSLGRRVALKVLPFASTLDARQMQRFKNEAQAAAHLYHQNIVAVYATGCERGVHYYAMQFIEGRDLARVLSNLRKRSGGKTQPTARTRTVPHSNGSAQGQEGSTGKNGKSADPSPCEHCPAASAPETQPVAGLSTERSKPNRKYFESVARLGIQAAEALDHAHQQGVVHRDVKPANLMVDSALRLWVTDFGLAHIQSEAGLTMSGDLVGTLRYMSPEQALAKRVVVDHRTDIYSLGATLYELLTLEPAFGGRDRQELLRQIAFEEPRRPRLCNRAIPQELETIVLKAMEKNPADRYGTAQELADDLRNFLENRPIRARRPSWRQVGIKWARRHGPLVWAATILFLLAAIFGGSLWLWWTEKRAGAEGAARAALQEALALQQQEKWPEALSAIDRAKGVLAGVGAREDLLQQVTEQYRELEMARRLEEARLEPVIGWSGSSEDWQRPTRAFAAAFRWYGLDLWKGTPEEVAERIGASSIRGQIAAALDEWAYFGKLDEDPRWGRLVAIARVTDPDPWRNRLRDALEQKNPKALEKLAASAQAEELPPATAVLLAWLAQGTGAMERALGILRQVQQRHPDDVWVNVKLGDGLMGMAPARDEEALRYYSIAVALRPQSFMAHNLLGFALAKKGLIEEALFEFRKARNPDGDKDSFLAYLNLGGALGDNGHFDDALTFCQKAIQLRKNDARGYLKLGIVLFRKNQLEDAVAALRKSLALLTHQGLEVQTQLLAYQVLAHSLTDMGRDEEAIGAWREAIAFRRKTFNRPEAFFYHNLGIALESNGQVDEAILANREAIKSENDFAPAYFDLGNCLLSRHQLDEAIAAFQKAVDLNYNGVGQNKLHWAQAYNGLGNALLAKGKLDEAIAAIRKATHLIGNEWVFHNNLAVALREKGQVNDAIATLRLAVFLKMDAAAAYCNLSAVLADNGQLKAALAVFQKAEEALPAYQKAVEKGPGAGRGARSTADAYDSLAWLLATSPHEKLRDPSKALAYAKKTVELRPMDGYHWCTLGVALYRNGKWKEAVAACEQTKSLQYQRDCKDFLLLAMAHWQLGDKDQARSWYGQGVAWMQKNYADRQVRRFHQEAKALLGVDAGEKK